MKSTKTGLLVFMGVAVVCLAGLKYWANATPNIGFGGIGLGLLGIPLFLIVGISLILYFVQTIRKGKGTEITSVREQVIRSISLVVIIAILLLVIYM